MVPLFAARVADLRIGDRVLVTCTHCRHETELPVTLLRERCRPSDFVKHLGLRFRCTHCARKGAELDARHALGHFG